MPRVGPKKKKKKKKRKKKERISKLGIIFIEVFGKFYFGRKGKIFPSISSLLNISIMIEWWAFSKFFIWLNKMFSCKHFFPPKFEAFLHFWTNLPLE